MTNEKLTAAQFIERLSKKGEVADVEVSEKVSFDFSTSYKAKFVISNSVIHELELINYVGRYHHLSIENKSLLKGLSLTSAKNNLQFRVSEDSELEVLTLRNYALDELLVNFKVDRLLIENSADYTLQVLTINQDKIDKTLSLIRVSGGQIMNFTIKSAVDSLEIEEAKIEQLNSTANVNFCYMRNNIIGGWEARRLQSERIELREGNNFHSRNFDLADFHINQLMIETSNNFANAITIGKGHFAKRDKLDSLIFYSHDKSPRPSPLIWLHRVELKILDFTGYQSLPNLELKEVIVETELNLNEVVLIKPLFDVLDLRRCKLKIYKTKFVEPEFNYVEWSTNNKFYEFEDMKPTRATIENYLFRLKNLREGYRQMKISFLQKNNMFDAMVFQNNELRIQKEIKFIETWGFQYRPFWHQLRSWYNNFEDWFLLATNSLFSNYGLSFTKPLMWLFLFHSILLYCIFVTFDLGVKPAFDIATGQLGFDLDATYEGSEIFLKLLFPVHDSDIEKAFTNTNPKTTVDIWGWLDFFVRILSSYFIFLIVRGTRKFHFKMGT